MFWSHGTCTPCHQTYLRRRAAWPGWPLLCVRRTRTSLGRAVHTAHRVVHHSRHRAHSRRVFHHRRHRAEPGEQCAGASTRHGQALEDQHRLRGGHPVRHGRVQGGRYTLRVRVRIGVRHRPCGMVVYKVAMSRAVSNHNPNPNPTLTTTLTLTLTLVVNKAATKGPNPNPNP